jgi:hypothetical protein
MRITDSQIAFDTALENGALSMDRASLLFIGDFMYMGDNENGAHLFKHKMTRKYLPPVAARTPVTKPNRGLFRIS